MAQKTSRTLRRYLRLCNLLQCLTFLVPGPASKPADHNSSAVAGKATPLPPRVVQGNFRKGGQAKGLRANGCWGRCLPLQRSFEQFEREGAFAAPQFPSRPQRLFRSRCETKKCTTSIPNGPRGKKKKKKGPKLFFYPGKRRKDAWVPAASGFRLCDIRVRGFVFVHDSPLPFRAKLYALFCGRL